MTKEIKRYHLKYGAYLSDLMRTTNYHAENALARAIFSTGHGRDVHDIIRNVDIRKLRKEGQDIIAAKAIWYSEEITKNCKDVSTNEGMESCLVSNYKEDFSYDMNFDDEKFEAFIDNLNKSILITKKKLIDMHEYIFP